MSLSFTSVSNFTIDKLPILQVPSKAYKIPTAQLKEGVVAVNFSESKNFEADVKDKVSRHFLYVVTNR